MRRSESDLLFLFFFLSVVHKAATFRTCVSGKVVIPANKPFIYMRGNGKGRTSITHESDSNDIAESATFIVNANNVVVFGISFRNNAKVGEVANSAVAAMVAGDKVAFYHCAFYSSHQTLFDSIGRHYYESCYIQGSIDFIFGNGQSMFQSPEIFVKPDRRTTIQGSITAQGPKEGDNGGFVFLKGMVYGVGEVYLGRVTESNSRVIFSSTYLSKAITPAGWARDGYTGSTANVLFAEYNCTGPGAVASSRVPWSRQLNKDEAAKYLTVDFIGGKDWLPAYY